MRKILLALIGVAILVGAYMFAQNLIASRKIPKPRERKVVTSVFTKTVQNGEVPVTISTNGTLTAKYRLELFSEVQGIFEKSAGEFKPGEHFKRGSTLIKINSDEHRASLRSQKSNLYNQVVLLLPDLRLDFPEAFPKWEAYVNSFDLEGTLQPLPEPSSDKEKLFTIGRNILSAYYAAANLEERLAKYVIRAPYYGVLTQASVTQGALVRAGQKLGEFISPNTYELEVPINTKYADMVRVGQQVNLHNLERTKNYQGKVIRVNSIVDQSTQTIQVFILVKGIDLRENGYLEADLEARKINNALEIDRKLLVNDDQVFSVRDSILEVKQVEPLFFKESSVVVKGLEDGTKILSKSVPGAYPGMLVQVLDDISTTN
ncbi:MAG: HlyD family efflux transporter periplasmic adaptor subunit [Saprospiraceae bacterium]|nr:HlyD family efflux transporter periplasmic adaptor subunit [Saprospiraceae bacterium]